MEQNKKLELSKIRIVDYLPKHRSAFKELNEEWISRHFKMEESDRIALDTPEEYILDPGGAIVVAVMNRVVVGVCALQKMQDGKYDYELAKMAVSPQTRGLGIGELLGKATIEKAQSLGASCLYLESNTVLTPAISLYKKLGFKEVSGVDSPYERCNIQMELKLD